MTLWTFWWVLAGVAVVAELLTGTLYLLLVAVGFAAAAIAAHAGAALPWQIVLAAVIGLGAVLALRQQRRHRPPGPPPQANPDLNLDIGQAVQVDAWAPDGTASVMHRGARWTAVPHAAAPLQAGTWRVREIVGSRLVVEPAA